MKQLGIIPCGIKKVWDKYPELGAVPAMEAYIGTFHTLCRNYAKTFTDNWVILSAKHGFLFAEDIVDGPYDVTFNQKSDEIISMEQLREQVRMKQLDKYDEIIVLTGKKYKRVVYGSFGESIPITFPLLKCSGIGYMQQVLKRAVNQGKPIH
ncbi:hypothetical protein F3157_18970 [Virgibacillus dakarensis]|uniref:DUF6884 domain-containing protein n=1 Tax=Virgibacillus dakarensis TaxID=1917889 RepID=UPI000B452681|nr:DUF6884 domain-containing protein [Virgibacillus dakarensis]MBT2216254.1 hypothetical protein [Virgibacillus dakarensis]MTW87702.1 hypothetical protein [Virgibacillus dakarensis]